MVYHGLYQYNSESKEFVAKALSKLLQIVACFCCSDLPKGFFKTSLFLTLCCNMCNLSPHFLCVSQNDVWAEVPGFPHERLRVFADEGLLVVAGCVVPRDAVVIPVVVDTETSLHRHSTGVQQILCIIWLSHRT